jgi:predicted metal-dependent hydrolase
MPIVDSQHSIITPRRVSFDWQMPPRHWLDGRPGMTHMANALHLLFPPGERWFARVAHRLLPQLRDTRLAADAKGFMGQEGNHARTHDTFLAVLAAQGFRLRGVAKFIERDFQRHERLMPLKLQVAIISGVEHYTAALGRWAFERDVFNGADPMLRDLFLWHAAEELEHKSVAFDLRAAVAPGYVTRALGLIIATTGLVISWTILGAILVRQDPETSAGAVLRDLARAHRQGKAPFATVARAFMQYLRPGFHPSQDDDLHHARAYLAESPAVAALPSAKCDSRGAAA